MEGSGRKRRKLGVSEQTLRSVRVVIFAILGTLACSQMLWFAKSNANNWLVSPSMAADEEAHYDHPTGLVRVTAARAGSIMILPKTNSSKIPRRRHSAAICAICVKEERYLDEWIDYHLSIGFDKIYLFDNSDKFELKHWNRPQVAVEKREKWVPRHPQVDIIHHPGRRQQQRAYHKCLIQRLRHKHTYGAFLDIDEFLVLRKHAHVVDMLHDHLPVQLNGQTTTRAGALQINWYVMGTANETAYRPLPMSLRFRYRLASESPAIQVKTIGIVRAMHPQRLPFVHHASLCCGKDHVDTNGVIYPGNAGFNITNGPTDVATIYHYRYKSADEYLAKRGRGSAGLKTQDELDAEMEKARKLDLPAGEIFDDIVWRTLKRNVPKYNHYDKA